MTHFSLPLHGSVVHNRELLQASSMAFCCLIVYGGSQVMGRLKSGETKASREKFWFVKPRINHLVPVEFFCVSYSPYIRNTDDASVVCGGYMWPERKSVLAEASPK